MKPRIKAIALSISPIVPEQEFYKFLVEQFPQRGGGVNTKVLGNYLKSVKGRRVDGRALVPAGTASGGVTRWTLEGARRQPADILTDGGAPVPYDPPF